jgi:hypothetical protein
MPNQKIKNFNIDGGPYSFGLMDHHMRIFKNFFNARLLVLNFLHSGIQWLLLSGKQNFYTH